MSKNILSKKLGMVDVSYKDITRRVAVATSTIKMSNEAFNSLVKNQSPKGNVLETAKIAGIMAAKSTPNIIPMCHPLELKKANVLFELIPRKLLVQITAEVVYEGKTGVEMEALMAVSVSALTIYDMLKWADKKMIISNIKLLHKTGGKSGDFHRQ